ncbi:unnamed protein product [Medioppia subpectinata]|uniref:Uncharacterized protein n=1 Tax=Medioppia subpectinata TaxID=1979941 RepID=A0A7R9PST4_9ACAR|nr:unnamed protein product [Medioppia subpectinata]CAG2099972.1 unnamed protein product [Medioppia subpectinata]
MIILMKTSDKLKKMDNLRPPKGTLDLGPQESIIKNKIIDMCLKYTMDCQSKPQHLNYGVICRIRSIKSAMYIDEIIHPKADYENSHKLISTSVEII